MVNYTSVNVVLSLWFGLCVICVSKISNVEYIDVFYNLGFGTNDKVIITSVNTVALKQRRNFQNGIIKVVPVAIKMSWSNPRVFCPFFSKCETRWIDGFYFTRNIFKDKLSHSLVDCSVGWNGWTQ